MHLNACITGLAKLCTFGFMCIGWIADVVFIALQVVKPADGTDYYMVSRSKTLLANKPKRPRPPFPPARIAMQSIAVQCSPPMKSACFLQSHNRHTLACIPCAPFFANWYLNWCASRL